MTTRKQKKENLKKLQDHMWSKERENKDHNKAHMDIHKDVKAALCLFCIVHCCRLCTQ